MIDIIDAIKDPNLFRPFLADADDGIGTWARWMTALRVVYGLPVPPSSHALIRQCTGRDPLALPAEGFSSALFLTGRRCGKSRAAAICGAYEAVLSRRWECLAPGEKGLVVVLAPTVKQTRIVYSYARAIFATPMLQAEVIEETKDMGFELRNGVRVEMLPGDYRSIRGYTLLAVVLDEAAFFGHVEESKVRSDTELIRAITPALATTGGRLIVISTPYAKKGWCYRQHTRYYGKPGPVLVWNCPSRTMNPTLPQAVVDEALAEDLQAAKSEFLGEFRDDVGEFLPRNIIEALVVPGRVELMPRNGVEYIAFADLSGGRVDDAAFAIAHREGRAVVIDLLRRYRPPFSPHDVCHRMSEEAKRYGVRRVVGDNYAAEFVARAFDGEGLDYVKSEKPKSNLYAELLPRLCSAEIELLDNPALVGQLAGLERRTRAGGRDIIDHPAGGHDDLANAVAGAADVAGRGYIIAGGLF